MKVYVINRESEHTCCGSLVGNPSGCFRFAFVDKTAAFKELEKLADKRRKILIKEGGYSDEEISVDKTENAVTLTYQGDYDQFYLSEVTVK